MHITCLRRGTGSARAAADYLVGDWDAAGHEREGVELLRGNPDVEAAYPRSDLFERRRRLMNDWSAYLDGARGRARHREANTVGAGSGSPPPLLANQTQKAAITTCPVIETPAAGATQQQATIAR